MTNQRRTVLYVGVTSDLPKRAWQHQNKIVSGFTKKYNINKLIYFERFDNIESAIIREKQIKKYSRRKKVMLINKFNPEWEDLFIKTNQDS
jgi:putative endonuclease